MNLKKQSFSNCAGNAPLSLIFPRWALVLISVFVCSYGQAAPQFQEATQESGISFTGPSFGASWGDFNADGLPDVWAGNHGWIGKPTLHLNVSGGVFRDVADDLVDYAREDMHGAAWADFDNDGDQDLLQQVGGGSGAGSGPNQLFINGDGLLSNRALDYGLDYPLGRGRTPLWFDWNNDGKLDVLLTNWKRPDGQAPTALFTQQNGHFKIESHLAGITNSLHNHFAQLTRLSAEHSSVIVLHGLGRHPDRIYQYDDLPFRELKTELGFPITSSVQDSVIADFNGDLLPDVYSTRVAGGSAAEQLTANSIGAVIKAETSEKGVRFQANGDVRFDLHPRWIIKPEQIFIGAQGWHPQNQAFQLAPTDMSIMGIADHIAGVDVGVYIGYDPETATWQLVVSNLPINIAIEASESVVNLSTIGFTNADGKLSDRLLIKTRNGFEDATSTAGLNTPTSCESVAAEDFDNDMDIDIYLVCMGIVTNRPNLLYENLGDGTFKLISDGGGAEGSLIGRGGSVATADYDGNGFVDLFVTNGRGDPPFGSGPHQLFRNLGNDNHWLEIDLEGVISNRDGIGARIVATTGGISQLREQNGGMHRFSQNHQRIHFGLGQHMTMDKLSIHWPSGIEQIIHNVPADQIIRVVEPSTPSIIGKPTYQPGLDAGVYLWQDTPGGLYHLRVNGDGPFSVYNISIIAESDFESVTPYKLEGGDVFEWSGNYISLESHVMSREDGFDFGLPVGVNALISVERDGKSNPRLLHIGASGNPLSPNGWIIDVDTLPEPPIFDAGKDLGIFLGRESITGNVTAHWSGDGHSHATELTLLSSQPLGYVLPIAHEQSDFLYTGIYAALSGGQISAGSDGIDVTVQPTSKLGFIYMQDGLFQSHRVNPVTRSFGLPNASWLPILDAFGRPEYDPDSEQGLFFWKDIAGVWRLRATAGGSQVRYRGTISANAPAIQVNPVMLEVHDTLDSSDLKQVNFDIQVSQHWEDGIDMQFPEDAQLCVDITTPGNELVKVGPQGISLSSPFDPVSLGPCQAIFLDR